jgi:hypothetical protein
MPVPILLICFNRPKIARELLLRIEELPTTKVYIAIDRADSESMSYQDNVAVMKEVSEFVGFSKHFVDVLVQPQNIGCNKNTIVGMDFLLSSNTSGLLLEDDCEFSPPYIEFLNRNYESIDYSKYMSVTPMNLNWGRDLYYRNNSKVFFYESVLMGASLGMTFAKESRVALDLALQEIDSQRMFDAIKEFSKECPTNFLQRKILLSYFEGKARYISRTWNITRPGWSPHTETGWDSAWQLAAILSDKLFLVPNFTLARETLNQEENQWHPHSFSYPSWKDTDHGFTIQDLGQSQPTKQPNIGAIHKLGIKRFPIRKYLALTFREFKSRS